MTIKELQNAIRNACIEFTRDNQIGIKHIDIERTIEFGSEVPVDYSIAIEVK